MEGGRGIKMGSIQEEAESFALGVSSTDKDAAISPFCSYVSAHVISHVAEL